MSPEEREKKGGEAVKHKYGIQVKGVNSFDNKQRSLAHLGEKQEQQRLKERRSHVIY